jgi:hypothetical protein
LKSFVLFGDDVAFKIQANIHRLSVPHSGAAPDALVVFFQAANICVAFRLDARLGLALGEAVCSGDRRPGIISALAVDGFVFGPSLAGGFCASAPLAARTRAIAVTDIKRIATSFGYPPGATMLIVQASSAHPCVNR